MRSGQLAHLTGVSTDTLRYYERLGLLRTPTRSSGNYRNYDPGSSERVRLIQQALKIGFSLKELKAILTIRDRGGIPCRHVRRTLSARMRAVERQIEELVVMRATLMQIAKDWDHRLSRAGKGKSAKLLENFPAQLPGTSSRLVPALGRNKGV